MNRQAVPISHLKPQSYTVEGQARLSKEMEVNQVEKTLVAQVNSNIFIDGKWRESATGRRFPVEDPSTREVIAEVADSSPQDAVLALDAASSAQDSWARTPPRLRGEMLRRAFELMVQRKEDLSLLMTLEMGKPLGESRGEVAYAAEFLRWFSEEAVRITGEYFVSPEGNSRILTLKQPVGPSLLITPWNFPLAMGTRKIGPALAAGCTVIVKPAQQTPLSMHALTQIFEEAGLPAGVLNLLSTTDPGSVTDALINDPRLRKLSFTGSTDVGKLLMSKASSRLLRLSMELGGNAPLIVFEDADMDKAVEGALLAKMRNMGEACTSANRILVQEACADEFTSRLSKGLQALRLGRGSEEGIQVGPLIDQAAMNKVSFLVSDARERGASVVSCGVVPELSGYFYAPTLITGVKSDFAIANEEIFGPIAPIYIFKSEEDAIDLANSTPYGLVAYLFTENLGRALRVMEKLETGMIGLNQGMVSNAAAPFGGVKESGFGREGGFEGIKEYLYTKYVAINHH